MEVVKNRFMFDTSALNQIINKPDDEMLIYQTKLNGFEYYFTEIQGFEAGNNISKLRDETNSDLVKRSDAELAVELLKLINKLQTKYVGQIATLRHNKWRLDGTFTLVSKSEQGAALLFSDILNNNDYQYYNDAMIAMCGIVYGCTIVTNDKRLYKKINKHFPDRAINYASFISFIKA